MEEDGDATIGNMPRAGRRRKDLTNFLDRLCILTRILPVV